LKWLCQSLILLTVVIVGWYSFPNVKFNRLYKNWICRQFLLHNVDHCDDNEKDNSLRIPLFPSSRLIPTSRYTLEKERNDKQANAIGGRFMKYVSIEHVETGQYLGKTVYSANGTALLTAGVQLTVFMINTLNRIGVTMLYIQDPAFEDVDTEDILSDATKQAVFREMNDALEAIRSGKEWSTKKLVSSINLIMEDVMSSKELLVQLTDIRSQDNAQYVHAMNVCLMSAIIGVNMGLNQGQLKDLAIGALLHDVGKNVGMTVVDKALANLNKGHHTWLGFELLKSKHEFSLLIAHIALQHHEQIDGKGLPRGLKAEGIHSFAKIVAVANKYDNLINPLNRGGMLPHEAYEELMAMSEQDLDHDVLVQFTQIISIYPNGMAVRLSTKETAVVVRQHRGLPGRPVVRIVRGSGDAIDVTEIDLAQHMTVFIEAVLA
jgi:HD-GYP domain-containing protein (c-di-GMP phosphodiesterase class II)